jgi:hypothetical protein
LASIVTGRTLNRKATGQARFHRTTNWATNWAKGVRLLVDEYRLRVGFYERIALPEDEQGIVNPPPQTHGGRLISLHYSSADGVSKRSQYTTIEGARRFAQKWLGETPEIGSTYAISGDGIGKITVLGATLAELFPRCVEPVEVVEVVEVVEGVEVVEVVEPVKVVDELLEQVTAARQRAAELAAQRAQRAHERTAERAAAMRPAPAPPAAPAPPPIVQPRTWWGVQAWVLGQGSYVAVRPSFDLATESARAAVATGLRGVSISRLEDGASLDLARMQARQYVAARQAAASQTLAPTPAPTPAPTREAWAIRITVDGHPQAIRIVDTFADASDVARSATAYWPGVHVRRVRGAELEAAELEAAETLEST